MFKASRAQGVQEALSALVGELIVSDANPEDKTSLATTQNSKLRERRVRRRRKASQHFKRNRTLLELYLKKCL